MSGGHSSDHGTERRCRLLTCDLEKALRTELWWGSSGPQGPRLSLLHDYVGPHLQGPPCLQPQRSH